MCLLGINLVGFVRVAGWILVYLFNYQKVDNKFFGYKLSKNVKSKLYHIENSKTRGQTV